MPYINPFALKVFMFIPTVGKDITITLPGELLRATVLKLVTNNAVIVQISTEPLARLSHSYKNGQVIACRRKKEMFGEIWEVVQQLYTSVEDLEKQEKQLALETRKRLKNDKLEHKGAKGARDKTKVTKTNRSNRPIKRTGASKGK